MAAADFGTSLHPSTQMTHLIFLSPPSPSQEHMFYQTTKSPQRSVNLRFSDLLPFYFSKRVTFLSFSIAMRRQ